MGFLIYGKCTEPYNGNPLQKNFKALDGNGIRVNKKTDAFEYATKEDAQEVIDKAIKFHADHNLRYPVVFNIRKS